MTIFSPNSVGSTETRKSISLPRPIFSLMRPSCGRRRSAMSRWAMILMRLVSAAFSLQRRRHLLLEHAVDAVAHAVALLVGLDVNVGRALLDRVQQDDVAQLDDRRVLGRALEVEHVLGVAFALREVDVLVHVAEHLVEVERGQLLRCLVVLAERVVDRDFRRDHHVDVVAGQELEVVERQHVGRVAHGDDQRLVGAVDRDDAVLARHVLRDESDDVALDVELAQVDRRDAVLLGQELRQVLFLDDAELDQAVAEALTRLLGRFLGLLQLIGGDELLADEELAKSTHDKS